MFYLGLDLGKKHDHTAIAIVEKPLGGGLELRYAERVALGMADDFLLWGHCRRLCSDEVPVRSGLIGKCYFAPFLPQDAVIQTDLLIEKKAEEEGNPGCVIIEGIVIFRGGLADPGQLVPGNRREIVVFVVMAHIEGDHVQPAIVAVGLLVFIVGQVMFLDPAGAQRMEANREEEAGK